MQGVLGLTASASVLLATLVAFYSANAEDFATIGATLPTTGPLAGAGLQTWQGLQLAEQDINAAGGINGKKIRFQVEDTQASNSVAINAFLRLEQQKLPFVFLSSYTVQNLATEPEVAKAKVPVMYAGGGLAVATRSNPYMFRIRGNDGLRVQATTESITEVLKKKRVAIINVQDQYGHAAAAQLKQSLIATGVEVMAVETYGMRDTDFAPQLLNMRNAGAEAVAVFGYIRDLGLMLMQRRALGLTNIPFVSVISTSTLELLTPPDLENVIGISDAVLGPANPNGPKSVKFAKDFTEHFQVPPDGFGAVYYDGGMIVAEALKLVGPDREKIRDYIAKLKDYQGVAGSYSTATNGDMLHHCSIVEYIPGTKDVRVIKDVNEK